MKTILTILFTALVLQLFASDDIKIHPIQHATFFIEYGDLHILVDPAGDFERIKSFPTPDIILVTHTHGDHMNPELIYKIKGDNTTVIGNRDAINQLRYGIYMMNFEKKKVKGIGIEAFPMYNTTADRLNYHPKGNGNGYVLQFENERVYISGDTEDIKEMRELKNIDHALLCMNLPFTMTPRQAASAVADFMPKKVYPYHYSQKDGFASVEQFKELVQEACDSDVEVILLDWYDLKE